MDSSNSFEDFLGAHKSQLLQLEVPEYFWPALHNKLSTVTFDAGNAFQLVRIEYDESPEENEPVWALQAITDIKHADCDHIYLVDHAWVFEGIQHMKAQLREHENLRTRMASMLGIESHSDNEKMIEEIFKKIWKICHTYTNSSVKNDEFLPSTWYVMDEVGSAVTHSEAPTCRIVPFFDLASKTIYSLLFPIKDIEAGSIITRNMTENVLMFQASKVESLCSGAGGDKSDVIPQSKSEYYLSGHIKESLPNLHLLNDRLPSISIKQKYKVFTEYDLIRLHLHSDRFEIVDDANEADILWYTHHFVDYATLSESPDKFINQFPFEYIITIKDLLCYTCKSETAFPPWLPITYNMKTEICDFLTYFTEREKQQEENLWIAKPFNLARSLDIHITDNLHLIVSLMKTGPKIVQKYITNPVLFERPECGGKVKFDIRYVILLTEVRPTTAFAYKNFFLRFANKPFDLDDLQDYEKHFTVMNYQEGSNIKHILCQDFIEEWGKQYPGYSWDAIEESIFGMMGEALSLATKEEPPCGIAQSPQSRAMYAVDLMLEWTSGDLIQPRLLEINWMPDCQRACDFYPDFFDKIFNLLFCNDVSEEFYKLL